MGLNEKFACRGWSIPLQMELREPISGAELLQRLDIAAAEVEFLFVNGKVQFLENAAIQPGDRVALAPPGTPGPYRVLLGIKNREIKPKASD